MSGSVNAWSYPEREAYRPEQKQRAERKARPQTAQKKGKRFYDFALLLAVVFIFATGLLLLYSGSSYYAVLNNKPSDYYFMKQCRYGLMGLGAGLLISLFNYQWLRTLFNGMLCRIAYWGSLILLLMTAVLGRVSHGKARWFSIGGQSFQPVELMKIGLILNLAYWTVRWGKELNQPRTRWKMLGIGAFPSFIVLFQNISSAFILMGITVVMVFVVSDRKAVYAVLGVLGAGAVVSARTLASWLIQKAGITQRPEKYWLRRIVGWAAPEIFEADAYQTMQGIYAIGSGGLHGRNIGESIQKFGKVPEVHNDMIFTIICEEMGFIGAFIVVVLYLFLLYRIIYIGSHVRNRFGAMICTGIMAHIGIQVVLNIAVVTGVIPNTGVTLPFFSYGGSAIVCTMAEMGLVLSIAHRIRTE